MNYSRDRDEWKEDGNPLYTWGYFVSGFTPRPLGEDAPRVPYWPLTAACWPETS